jgi:hypothetical protein
MNDRTRALTEIIAAGGSVLDNRRLAHPHQQQASSQT